MKKFLTLLLLLFVGMANAQIVNIPDATLKTKLLAASATDVANNIAQDFNDNWMVIDANGDGEIQLNEAQSVKLLTIFSGYSITDITGISSFTNLETFSISNNLVTSIDLSALTNLKSFSCLGMYQLSSLNLNNLTNLTSLFCFDIPNLAPLNLNNLTSLTRLNISLCSLTSLNINGLSNLTELYCTGNQLTNLNGLPASLTKLNCSQNLFTSLNLNGLPNLTELYCSNNQLTNLNGLPNLSKLNCAFNKLTSLNINTLTNLTEFTCSQNELTTLNLNGLTNLTALDCTSNKLINLNITNLPNLVSLDCGYNDDLSSITLSNLPALQDFKVISRIDSSANSLGHLTNLNFSGLPNLLKLDCSYGILTSLNLSGLTNLTELNCSSNFLTDISLNNLPNLQKLDCSRNHITSIDASDLSNLVELNCGNAYVVDGQLIGYLASLNVAGLANLKKLNCSQNLLSSLDLTGLVSLEELYCDGINSQLGNITSINLNGLSNLKRFSCSWQQLTSLNVSNLVNLVDLYCTYNQITNLDLTGLINLKTLDYTYNQLSNLNLVNLPSLTNLSCAFNELTTLNVLNLTSLTNLTCSNNQLTSLNLSGLSALEVLNFANNHITISNISGLSTNLKSLYCDINELSSLDVSNLTNLENLSCSGNQLTNIDVSTLNNLKNLNVANNLLTNIDVSNLTLIESLSVDQNQLTTLDLNGLTNLKQLTYSNNVIPNLDVSFLTNLERLDCSITQSTVLNVTPLTNLRWLYCSNNQLTSLNLAGLNILGYIDCQANQLTTIDVSNTPFLQYLYCDNNQLSTLFLKNGTNETNLSFTSNPGLQYICADGSQIQSIQTQLNSLGMNATVCNSYCSFTPGGNHNTITGIAIFDANNDGCDVTDVVNPFVRLNINDGSVNGATVTNINGTYNFYTDAGNYTIAPNTENPTWFDFSPTSADFAFTNNNNNISTQNFCITAVGLHKDVEVILSQTEPARPGFDASYKIVFKNKGNQMLSGAVTLQFDDARTDFGSSMPIADVVATNSLSWNFINLMPFENRSIQLTLNINSPVEVPAVNNGDILNFITTITPITGDEFPNDNTFNYNQTVVGSFDPNAITCLEGNSVSPSEIGNYLHYMVNFENTGTFYAQNVVVRLEVDSDKFDMNSLQLLNSSNPSSTRITGNIVEFVLQDINLAAAHGSPPVGGHGDVLFKIKTKDNLFTNDTVIQRAGIYFDYNYPVETNDAETTFAELSNGDFELDNSVKIYPNPTNSIINIDSKFSIDSIQLYDVQGRILETHFETTNTSTLDISNKSNGIYFLKIKTEKGSKVQKIVKE